MAKKQITAESIALDILQRLCKESDNPGSVDLVKKILDIELEYQYVPDPTMRIGKIREVVKKHLDESHLQSEDQA